MKKCRHCGTENDDSAVTCSECWLSLSPSPAAQLVARLPSAVREANTKWLWRVLLIVGIPLLLLTVYLLGLGPILRIYGAKPDNAWNRVPGVVRTIYEPLDRMPIPGWLARPLRGYNKWWMGVERDKREFRKLMARIDAAITNGMTEADVIGFLGQPLDWSTNGDVVVANYMYMPYMVLEGGTFTNGFVISFTNGAVFRKTASTWGN